MEHKWHQKETIIFHFVKMRKILGLPTTYEEKIILIDREISYWIEEDS